MSMYAASPQILIVDDDVDYCQSLQDLLSVFGRSAVCLASGQEALEYLRTRPHPQLILLDWAMPGMDGGQFLREFVRDPALAEITVVIATGYPASRLVIPLAVRCRILEKPFG